MTIQELIPSFDNLPDLMTPAQVSRVVGVSASTLANHRCNHTGISLIKLQSGAVRYRKADVAASLLCATAREAAK